MASLLHSLVQGLPGVKVLYPRQANSVFLEIPVALRDGLRARGWRFYDFIGWGGARLMCSWDTTEADVQAFARDLAELARAQAA